MNGKYKTLDLIYMAIGAALIAVCSWVTIPLVVPFTLQTFAVFTVVELLGGKKGCLSILVYILLGAVGLPVFSGFKGGIGALIGTTGGYIIGFIFIANYFYLKTYSKADTKERLTRIMVQFFSIAAVFAGPIYVPRIHTAFYKNTFPTFAWHSPTQQMMTLFVVLGTMCFFMMLDNYEKKISPGWWLGAAVFYLLSAYTKPSFILDFVPAVVIAFIIELCIKSELSFGEKFKRLFIMGCSLVPSGLYMIFLNYYISQREESDGNGDILVTSAKIAEYDHLWVAICCCMAFPLVVMLFNWKRIFKDRKYRLIILAAIMGLLQWGLLGESGRRASHNNFGWGRIIGGYMLMLTSMAILVDNVRDKEFLGGKKWLRGLYFLMAAGSLALHLICNVYYFVTICAGGGYWR